ncbi:zinc finger protein 26-like [Ostrinia furnacalis]|uniref:zinc finger protein 26-like n=1 Tax=Ostrinia furnacalis TaxID=93504 RepID=UPI00103F4E45|nr:zinc finger protein 26-like [Ostrinia furnacalis]
MPFKWHTKGFSCLFCAKPMKDCLAVKEHTSKHSSFDLENFIPKLVSKDVPVKIDVTDLACKLCPQILIRTIDELVAHIVSIHDEDYDYTAGVCVLPFLLNKEVMSCVLCDKQFDNFTSIMWHMNKEHISHSHICQICGLSFINMIRLNRHITSSHIGFRCSLCSKVFASCYKLDIHKVRLHGHVKSHSCDLCSESFENGYLMKVHMGKVHNVAKYRIKCEYCPKICTTKGAMALHVKSVHSDARFECDICDYKTVTKSMIRLHKRKHFGDRNYACSVCERKFGRASNLSAHFKVHTGHMGRVCRHCRRGFTDNEALESHKMEVHYFDQE